MLSRNALVLILICVFVSSSFMAPVSGMVDHMEKNVGTSGTKTISMPSNTVDSRNANTYSTDNSSITYVYSSSPALNNKIKSGEISASRIFDAVQSNAVDEKDLDAQGTDRDVQGRHDQVPEAHSFGTRALLTADTAIVMKLPDEIKYGENLTVQGVLVEVPDDPSNYHGYLPVPFGQVTLQYPNNMPQDKQEYKVRCDASGQFSKEMPEATYPYGFIEVYANFSGHWYNAHPDLQTIAYWAQKGEPTVAYYNEWDNGGPQVRTGCQATAKTKLTHETEILNLAVSPSTVTVGGTVKVSGTLKDKNMGMAISSGVVELFLDGNPFPSVMNNTVMTTAGTFDFSGSDMVIPEDAYAGIHTFTVYFKRAKQTGQNSNLTDSQGEVTLKVKRTTEVIFADRLEEGEQVYRNTEVYINGSVLDNTGSPPKLKIGSEDFTYQVDVVWAGQLIGTTELTASGHFSLKYTIPPTQDLAIVTISIEFKPGSDAYYEGSTGDANWRVMSKPHITLSIDKYATRGSSFKIKGYLLDDLNKGIEGRLVFIKWGASDNRYEVETTDGGMFEYTYDIPTTQGLGPVYITVTFEGVKDKYDPATLPPPPADDGLVYICTGSWISVEPSSGIKGEQISVNGRLYDDQNKSIPYKTITFIWHKDKNDYKGIVKGYEKTGDGGTFSFSYTIGALQPVGTAWAELLFNGSSMPYQEGDAFFGHNDVTSNFEPVKKLYPDDSLRSAIGRGTAEYTIYAKTWLRITAPSMAMRNDTISINVELKEKIGNILGDPVTSATISLLVGDTATTPMKTSAQGIARFSVVLPPYLNEGKTTIRALYNSTKDSYYLKSENSTVITVRARTKFVIDQEPPSIDEGRMANWQMRLVEADSSTGDVVPRAPVTVTFRSRELNMDMTMHLNTSDYGRIIFNKSWGYIPKGALLDVDVEFVGDDSRYLEGSNISLGPYEMNPKPAPPTVGKKLSDYLPYIFVAILVIAAIVGLVIFIQRKRRVSAMKRIIERARDQLVAGDPYRQTIFLAYQSLVKHLRRYGYLRRQGETFREFESAVRSALPVDEAAMNNFVTLIEEARYSNHPIGPEHRDAAIKTLNAIEASLAEIEANPEMAMKIPGEVEDEAEEVEIVLTADELKPEVLAPTPKAEENHGMPPGPEKKGVPAPPIQKGLPPKRDNAPLKASQLGVPPPKGATKPGPAPGKGGPKK